MLISKKIIYSLVIPSLFCFKNVTAEEYFADSFIKALHYNDIKIGNNQLTDSKINNSFLINPESIYSETHQLPSLTNEITWITALQDFNQDNRTSFSLEDSVKIFSTEMGYTKAIPGVDVDIEERLKEYSKHKKEQESVVANATKANVDSDIFYRGLDIFSHKKSTVAAKFTVALQILRDKAKAIPESKHDLYGIRADIIDRYLKSFSVTQISEYDKNYLLNLLHSQISNIDHVDKNGNLEVQFLPVQYRIARVAAAYRDKRGYYFTHPCQPNGRHRTDEDNLPQCFTDMTDKALFSWYKETYKQEMHPSHRENRGKRAFQKLLKLLLPITVFLDGIAAVEFFESIEAEELTAEEAFSEEEGELSNAEYKSGFCSF